MAAPAEVWTVSDTTAVLFRGEQVEVRAGLTPDTDYEEDGVRWRTLPRPPGEVLATVAAVNDVHFGETRCGFFAGVDIGPVLSSPDGETPYPLTMNRAAVEEMALLDPGAVVVKGDVTTVGSAEEYDEFEATYRPVFGDRLIVTRGNHDNHADGQAFPVAPVQATVLPGVVLAVLDTSVPGEPGGRIDGEQLAWLDDLAAGADRPVLVFGHHPCFQDGTTADWIGEGAHLDPGDSALLVALVARRPAIVAYLAGHTHRNKVRRFAETGDVPFVEVGSVKDFPGSWAEYRVHEGGLLQIHHRLASPDAVAWSEGCRALFAGLYPQYAAGELDDRCFPIPLRTGPQPH